MTRTLLTGGLVAGPLYFVVSAVQALTRDGFDIREHSISLLSNGSYGWIQILNFVVTGALVVAFAIGLRTVLGDGRGQTWGPILIGIFGAGLIASGLFVADPSHGFPPGTPLGEPEQVTFSGIMHFITGGISFLGLIAACIIFAHRFTSQKEPIMAVLSSATGAFYLVSFVLVAATAGAMFANIMLTVAVVLGWVWLTVLAAQTLAGSTPIEQPSICTVRA